METLKMWDGARAQMGRDLKTGLAPPQLWEPGVLPRKIFETQVQICAFLATSAAENVQLSI